jgi:hypothetical protein
MEGSGCGVIRHWPRRTEKNHGNLGHDSRSEGWDPNFGFLNEMQECHLVGLH